MIKEDQKRVFFAIGLIFFVMIGWSYLYQKIYPPPPPGQEQIAAEKGTGKQPADKAAAVQDGKTPAGPSAIPDTAQAGALSATNAPEKEILIETPLVKARISTRGGKLTHWELKEHLDDAQKNPYEMVGGVFTEGPISSSLEVPGTKISDKDLVFEYTGPDTLELQSADRRSVVLTWSGPPGIRWTREISFTGDNYGISIKERAESVAGPQGAARFSLASRLEAHESNGGRAGAGPLALLSSQGKLQKKEPKDLFEDKESVSADPFDGWLGLGLHYFLFAWAPEGVPFAKASLEATGEKALSLSVVLPERNLAPGGSIEESVYLFLGPKDRDRLEAAGHGLKAALDLGFFAAIARALLWVLVHIDRFVSDYGWSIILLTVLVRLLMFPLSVWQFRSMKAMQVIQPQLKVIREKYKDDMARQQQEMMNLYRQHKVNPFGGCLPMLAQIPIFLGLYMALSSAIELRHAAWGHTWIHDLALKDPYYVLPVLMTASTYFSMKLTPNPSADPTQQKIMQLMPLMFFFLFLNMPAGLMLYWTVSNVLSMGQQVWINRTAKAQTPALAGAASGATAQAPSSNEQSAGREKRRGKKRG
ncbi:MAG: membrane protein insertase YidC [Bdellovibrionota bacterium]